MSQVIINGPEGRLEGQYQESTLDAAPSVLFLHPHPKYGGTMNNRVVYTLYQQFARRGCTTLRINFRGVGRSLGEFSRGEGELADAASAMDWLQQQNQHKSRQISWIVGFSFGAWIAMQLLMRRPEIVGFIGVAPPVNLYDFSFLAPCPASGLIVHGEDDQFVPAALVQKLHDRLRVQEGVDVACRMVPGADHFFTNKIDDLTDLVETYMDERRVGEELPPEMPVHITDESDESDDGSDPDGDDE